MRTPKYLLIFLLILPFCLDAQDWEVDEGLMRFTYEDVPGPPPAGPLISRWEVGIGNNFVDPNSFSLGIYRFVLDYIIKENAITIKPDNFFTGMGTDDPLGRLHVSYTNTVSGSKPALLVGTDHSGQTGYLMINKPSSDIAANIARFRDNGTTTVEINKSSSTYQLDVNGDMQADAYYLTSDARYKKDLESLESCVDVIKKLKPLSYHFIQDASSARRNLPSGKHYGFLAQDLQKVLPELVNETEALDEDGNSLGTTLSVNYIELIPILIGANQELQQEVEALRQLVLELKK